MLDARLRSRRMLWVELEGALDATSWDLLHGCMNEVAAEGGLVLDMRGVVRIDEDGRAVLARLTDALRAVDREVITLTAPVAAR